MDDPNNPLIPSNQTMDTLNLIVSYADSIEGAILFLITFYLAVVIFMTKRLRNQKEYIIMGSNMIFDAIFGMAYFLDGIYYLQVWISGELDYLTNKWHCWLTTQSMFFTVITPGAGWLSLFTLLDRLMSVMLPIKYMKLDPRYAYSIPILTFLCIIPTFVLSGITSYEVRDQYTESMFCDLQNTGSPAVYKSLRIIRIICCFACIPIYIPIVYRMTKIIRASTQYPGMSSVQKKKLKRMTITIMLITLNEILLFAAPDLYLILNPKNSSFIFFVMNLHKGLVNIIIFLCTQKELRATIFYQTFKRCMKLKPMNTTTVTQISNQPTRRPSIMVKTVASTTNFVKTTSIITSVNKFK